MADVDANSSAGITEQSTLTPPIVAKQVDPLPVGSSRIRTAVSVPDTTCLIFVTESNQIVYLDHNVSAPAHVRSIATVQYVTVQNAGLPTHCSVAIALLDGVGLVLYSLPSLERIEGDLDQALSAVSKNARLFAVDRLGTRTTIGDSFRIALSAADNVVLLSVNIPQSTVKTLSMTTVSEPAVALSFADMTIVATTTRNHYMLRIARSANMAMAAAVLRYDPTNRRRKSGQGADAGTAVLSFFGGFFSRKDSSSLKNQLAFPLPDNRWVLSVDDEWVTYSSFGAKLEDMENVFKSRKAIDISENEINAVLNTKSSPNKNAVSSPPLSMTSAPPQRLRKSNSISSMTSATSVASTYTIMTLVDEARASRAEKPVAVATFASPFVLCVTDNNELLAFAANGSIPGTIASLKLDEEKDGKQAETGAAIVPCMNDSLCVAMVYWPSGRVVEIQLADELEALIDDREEKGELRSALSLVPIDQVDRTISFRRKLAVQARQDDWHDMAIHHMQHVVNLCVARDGVGQLDLITEAVELRGPRGSSWEADVIVATLWADFLFRLRRRVMQPSAADIDIIQTLCRADVSSTRIKALLAVKNDVTMEAGEAAITAGDSALQEEERIEALVALYSSLGEHDKALVLLENSGMNRAFQVVCSFLSKSMRPDENPDVFFKHLQWVASESKESRGREADLMSLLTMIIGLAKKSDSEAAEHSLQWMMRIVVEYTPHLLDPLIELMNPTETADKSEQVEEEGEQKETTEDVKQPESNTEAPKSERVPAPESVATVTSSTTETEFRISTELYAISLLAGMSKADILQNTELFERLRVLFRNQILHNEGADYNPDKLVLALQAGHNESLALHEERAYLLGRQGQHEAAAMELASEITLSSVEAKRRLEKVLPVSDKAMSGQALVSAYLQVSGEGGPNRVACAAEIVQQEGGYVDIEKVMVELRQRGTKLTMAEARPFLRAALISGKERLRIAELVRAMRVSEVSRVREEVLIRRRRSVMIGDGRACSICTRGIDDTSVFAARPDGTVEHLACHTSRMSTSRSQTSNRSSQ